MNNRFLLSIIGSLIDDGGFSASDVARAALTHETETVVEPAVEETGQPRPKYPELWEGPWDTERWGPKPKAKRRKTIHCGAGAMQPDGDIFEAIKKSFYSFPRGGDITVRDIAAHSGHSMQRVRTVEAYLITQGMLRRKGHVLSLLA